MGKIPTYTAGALDVGVGGGRRASAEDFGSDFGSVGKGVSTAINAYVNDKEDDEARTALVESTKIRANYAKALDEAATSGADVEALKEKMNADLANIGANFQTKRGSSAVELYTANSNIMFDEKANAISVQRASIEARTKTAEFLRNAGSIIASNPGYVTTAEKDGHDFIDTFSRASPAVKAELKQGITHDLNMQAAVGSARIDPEGTKKKLEAGDWNLTPDQRTAALNRADMEIAQKRQDNDRAAAEARRVRAEDDDKARREYTQAILEGKSIKAAVGDPRLTAESIQNLMHFQQWRIDEIRQGAEVGNKSLEMSLFKRIFAPDGTPGKIYSTDEIFRAVGPGMLNTTQAARLIGYTQANKDENGRTFGSRLVSSLTILGNNMKSAPEWMGRPAEEIANIQLTLRDQAEKHADELRKAGQNPDAILDPDSKDYFFKPGKLKQIGDQVRQQSRTLAESGLPRVSTKAERDALPPGTSYVGPDGSIATTPGKKTGAQPSDTDQWRKATGGALKPGQTAPQAVAEWKANR